MKGSDWCDGLTEWCRLEVVTSGTAFRCCFRGRVTSPRVVDSKFASAVIDRLKRIGVHF